MIRPLLWILLLPPLVFLFLRLLARLHVPVLDLALFAVVAGVFWLVVWKLAPKHARADRDRFKMPTSREKLLESVRERLVAIESRIETVSNYLRELSSVRDQTQADLTREERPGMAEILRENLSRYDSLVAAQERYLAAMVRLREVVREKYDIYREKLRALKVTKGSPQTGALDAAALLEETEALDNEIAQLHEQIAALTDSVEATVEIEELVGRFR